MPNSQQFTIVVPTLDRAETLVHSLRTCVGQDYDNLTILVSDNVSTDNTRAVVESFDDPRIRYINPGERLSMSHHWEFALSHVKEGYVSILGDDDGFLPNAVANAARLLQETGLRAVRSNYGLYFWPSVNDATRANTLHVSFKAGYSVADGKTELTQVLRGQKDYLALPSLYNSFVDIQYIEAARQQSGQFFRSRIPDVYSGVALAGLVGQYVYSDKSLKVFGISGKSNGAAMMSSAGSAEIAARFLRENSLPIHPLAPSMLGRSIGLIIGESFLQSFDAGLNLDLQPQFDWQTFIGAAVQEMRTTSQSHADEIQRNIDDVRQKNKLDGASSSGQKPSAASVWQVISRFKDLIALVDAATYGATDIYGACQLYDAIYAHPLRYPGIVTSTLRKVSDTAAFATLMQSLRLTPQR